MYLILYSDIIHSVSELEDPCKVEVDGEISLIPSPEQLSSSLNSRHTVEADTVSEIPIVGRVLTVGYESRGKEDGRGNGHPLRVSRVNARRESARKRSRGPETDSCDEGNERLAENTGRGGGLLVDGKYPRSWSVLMENVPVDDSSRSLTRFSGKWTVWYRAKGSKGACPAHYPLSCSPTFLLCSYSLGKLFLFSSIELEKLDSCSFSSVIILVILVIIFRICVYCSTRYKFLLYFTFSIFESSESVFLLSLVDDTSSFFLELRIE